MTAAEHDASVDRDLAALVRIGLDQARTPPVPHIHFARCVCGADDEPELYRTYCRGEQHTIECNCGRYVGGPSKAIAIAMWNAVASK